jgi:lipoate---protein ligase
VFEVDRPAIVLGSAQRDEILDVEACVAAGVEVVRRRSGGGVVLLAPGEIVWFDVIVPARQLHDAGVGDDVRRSMIWLGERIAGALAGLGVGDVDVHRSAPTGTREICFAGTGPGEVTRGDAKLVGISQRRTRSASRFQCAVHTVWSPGALVELLAEPPRLSELPAVATLPTTVAEALPLALPG